MTRARARLWLRWSWRDLRRRWVLVTALALVIALGTGAFAGLGGTTAWRIASQDASYASLQMHDLKVRLPDGGFAPQGALLKALGSLPSSGDVQAADERLVVPTQVDASRGSASVLVPGELVGQSPTARVDTVHVGAGRALTPADEGRPTAVLESKFAGVHHLPASGPLVLSGGERLTFVGTGYSPEYFRITGHSGQVLGDSGYAVLYLPLRSAQQVSGHPGQVNDLVLRLRPGADRDRLRRELAAAVAPIGGTVTTRDDDIVYRGLYADARNDQTTWNTFALLILLGAAFACFNLVTRMIEAQRRELGVGMALGVTPATLAIRPLLVGVQIAVAGVVAGVGVGWLMGLAMRREFEGLLPLPVWRTPFQTTRFLQAAALGFVIPVVATVLPLRRALRLQPVEAIRTSVYASSGSRGAGRLVRRVRLPGRSWWSMPLRNVVRAPRRTLLTALGIAAAVTCLVAVLGLLDTFTAVKEQSSAEVERTSAQRLTVSLDRFHPGSSEVVRGVAQAPGAGDVSGSVRLPATVTTRGHTVEVVVEVLDLGNHVWSPSLVQGSRATAAEGIILSRKAAHDLKVGVGDTVDVRHPVLSPTGLTLTTTPFRVSGLHPHPLRAYAYLDSRWAASMGLAGTVNTLAVVPAKDTSQSALVRNLFARPGVSAVEPAAGFAQMVESRLDEFTGILRVIEVATLLLALLIAFNAASLSADERARDNATMFAFGLPPRVVSGMGMAENAVIGAIGALVGLGGGWLALTYLVAGFDTVMPEVEIDPTVSTATWLLTFGLTVVVVSLAPLLSTRRLRRMDIPATLRVVE
jgi:putative ABC transport system permease protein